MDDGYRGQLVLVLKVLLVAVGQLRIGDGVDVGVQVNGYLVFLDESSVLVKISPMFIRIVELERVAVVFLAVLGRFGL